MEQEDLVVVFECHAARVRNIGVFAVHGGVFAGSSVDIVEAFATYLVDEVTTTADNGECVVFSRGAFGVDGRCGDRSGELCCGAIGKHTPYVAGRVHGEEQIVCAVCRVAAGADVVCAVNLSFAHPTSIESIRGEVDVAAAGKTIGFGLAYILPGQIEEVACGSCGVQGTVV